MNRAKQSETARRVPSKREIAAAKAAGKALKAACPRDWFNFTTFYLKDFGKLPDTVKTMDDAARHLIIDAGDAVDGLTTDVQELDKKLTTQIDSMNDGVSYASRISIEDIYGLLEIGDLLQQAQRRFEFLSQARIARGVRRFQGENFQPYGRPLTQREYCEDLARKLENLQGDLQETALMCEQAEWFIEKEKDANAKTEIEEEHRV